MKNELRDETVSFLLKVKGVSLSNKDAMIAVEYCDCGGYASNRTDSDRGTCDSCGKEKV